MSPTRRACARWRHLGPPTAVGLVASILLAPVAAPAEQEAARMVLSATLNEAPLGDVLVLRGDGRTLVGEADMERAGLLGELLRHARVEADGARWTALEAMRGVLASEVDEEAGTLRMTARPEALRTTDVSAGIGARGSEVPPQASPSAFANYALRYSQDGASAAAELGAAWRAGALRSDFTWAEGRRGVRGLSVLAVDEIGRQRRWSFGDAFASAGRLGGAGILGGLTVTTDFSLRPGFSPMPSFGETGIASTPSVLEIYSNGSLVRQAEIPPGPFRVSDLPVTVGANDARVVVRDAFGRTFELRNAFYVAGGSLAPGTSRYTYAAGFLRHGLGTESFHYGDPVLVAAHRLGVDSVVTLGGRVELAPLLVSGGPVATLRLPVGEMELAGGASVDGAEGGCAGLLGYSFLSRRFSASAQLTLTSARYSTATARASEERDVVDGTVVVGASPASSFSYSILMGLSRQRRGVEEARGSLTASVRLGPRSSLAVGVGLRAHSERGTAFEGYAALHVGLDGPHAATVTSSQSSNGQAVVAEVSRATSAGDTDVGWRARADRVETPRGPATGAEGSLVVQHPWGRGAVDARWNGEGRVAAELAGGLVVVGGRLAPTRTVNGGFALIRVPGVEGVRGYLNNHEVGRTDSSGDLVVPGVMPYEPVQLSVNDQDIPGEYRVGETRRSVALFRNAGAVVPFDVSLIRAVRGTVTVVDDRGKRVVPKNGELQLGGAGGLASPIGSAGQFELEGLEAGTHEAEVWYVGGRCALRLEVPETAERITELGELECAR